MDYKMMVDVLYASHHVNEGLHNSWFCLKALLIEFTFCPSPHNFTLKQNNQDSCFYIYNRLARFNNLLQQRRNNALKVHFWLCTAAFNCYINIYATICKAKCNLHLKIQRMHHINILQYKRNLYCNKLITSLPESWIVCELSQLSP